MFCKLNQNNKFQEFKLRIILTFLIIFFNQLNSKAQDIGWSRIYSKELRVGVYDSFQKKVIIPANYYRVGSLQYRNNRLTKNEMMSTIKSFYYWVEDSSNLSALFNYQGIRITKFEYKSLGARSIEKNFLAVLKGEYWGVIDTGGNEILPFLYKGINCISNNIIPVLKDSLWGAIDLSGKEIVPFVYNEIRGDRLWVLNLNNKYFYYDPLKRVRSSDSYDFIDFGDTHLNLFTGNKMGYFNINKKILIKPIYEKGRNFVNGFAIVYKNKKLGFIDESGKPISNFLYEEGNDFEQGFAAVEFKGKWGFINTTGQLVIPCEFTYTYAFNKELAIVGKMTRSNNNTKTLYGNEPADKEMYYLINKRGIILTKAFDDIKYENYSNSLTYRVLFFKKYGYLNLKGNESIPCMYDEISEFYEGRAKVKKEGRAFYINDKNIEIN